MLRVNIPAWCLLAILSVLSGSGLCGSTTTDSISNEMNPPPPDSLETLLVAVADFRATMLSRAEAGALADGFCTAMAADRRLRVVDRNEFAGLRNSNDFGPLSQCTQLGCALDIGRQFGADAVVIGAVSRERKGLVLTIRLVDVEEKALRQKLASKVYADQQGLLAHAVPELVSRLLDPADTVSNEEARKIDSSAGKTFRGAMDTGHIEKNPLFSHPIPRKQAKLNLAKVAAYGAGASGGLILAGFVVAISFPAACADRGNDATNEDGEDDLDCVGRMLETGFFLYRAGLVVGSFAAVVGVLAVVQRWVPAKPAASAHRRLVLTPFYEPFGRSTGLQASMDF